MSNVSKSTNSPSSRYSVNVESRAAGDVGEDAVKLPDREQVHSSGDRRRPECQVLQDFAPVFENKIAVVGENGARARLDPEGEIDELGQLDRYLDTTDERIEVAPLDGERREILFPKITLDSGSKRPKPQRHRVRINDGGEQAKGNTKNGSQFDVHDDPSWQRQ